MYGDRYQDQIVETVRKSAEYCDCLQSFFILHSMGGGKSLFPYSMRGGKSLFSHFMGGGKSLFSHSMGGDKSLIPHSMGGDKSLCEEHSSVSSCSQEVWLKLTFQPVTFGF